MAEAIPSSPQEVYKRSITIATPVLGLSGRQSWDLPQHAPHWHPLRQSGLRMRRLSRRECKRLRIQWWQGTTGGNNKTEGT